MLLRLLRLISDTRGITTTPEMAQKLGMSEGLASETIDQGVALGYLVLLQPDCSKAPSPLCRERSSCPLHNSLKVWSLTGKGERFLVDESTLETPNAPER